MGHYVDQFFAHPEGRIFSCFPGAEARPGQQRLAQLVFDSILEGTRAREAWKREGSDPEAKPNAVVQAVEAGTGTGKSLGYLIPALASGRTPVLVATRTKQLQRQLLEEDLPRAVGILGRPVKAVLAKGRANYLCLEAWSQVVSAPPAEMTRHDHGLWLALQRWSRDTETGDREELGRFGEGESPLWDRINARAERCTGKQCARYEECFLTKLRQEVQEADLIIVNHALLLADRVLRESAFGQVLPDAPVLVLDEAHEIEEQLTESCAESWSSRAMTLLFTDLHEALRAHPDGAAQEETFTHWRESWDRLMGLVPVNPGTYGFEDEKLHLPLLADAVGQWAEAGEPMWREAKRFAARSVEDPTWGKLAERIGTAFSRMERVFAQPEGWVSTLTREGPLTVMFKSNPVDVRPFFHQHLRRGFETVILTSATLRDGRGFNGLGLRLGLSHEEVGRSEHVESPFDFQEQGLLFVPPGMPLRRAGRDGVGDPSWVETSLEAMERLIRASRGRALLLFTSRKMLQAFEPRLRAALPEITFFAQGGEGLSRTQILERFRATPNAALLGLASFWQGVDLPGDALTLVVVTALPFAPPDDPVLSARIQQAEAQKEGLGFVGIQVPQMTLKLKQGIGRLIRTRRDRGVVAILDPRLLLPHEDPNGKRYAAQVRASLPPFPIVREWKHVEGFLRTL